MKTKFKLNVFLLLHASILIYALGTICSKMAATSEPFSMPFFIWYGGFIGCLGVYALAWQQVLKKVPLVTAFCNKAITIVWGMLFGVLFFQETITLMNVIGAVVVIAGVIMVVTSDE